jgi:tetratricopeptide (TPR) repeat protein
MKFKTIGMGGVFSLVFLLFLAQESFAEVSDFACGSLKNSYGPFDYRSDKDKLDIVEGAHFTPEVENLIRGKSGYLGSDIDYTLRAFPNHHRALMAMVRLGEKERRSTPGGAHYSVECYLYRASRFRPDDGMVKMIYANYLVKNGRSNDALKYLDEVEELGEGNANLYYNMGLIYLDLKISDKALIYAHRAYQMGFPLPGLRDRLKRIGKWSDLPAKPEGTEVISTPGSN